MPSKTSEQEQADLLPITSIRKSLISGRLCLNVTSILQVANVTITYQHFTQSL